MTVSYRFSENHRRGWDRVLVIPVDDLARWYVFASEERPFEARKVFARAYRRFMETGEWPQLVAYSS